MPRNIQILKECKIISFTNYCPTLAKLEHKFYAKIYEQTLPRINAAEIF